MIEEGKAASAPGHSGCTAVGGTHEELCGAFTGGLMVIGVLHGRISAKENDDYCQQLADKLLKLNVVTRGKLEDMGQNELADKLEAAGKLPHFG